MDNTKERRGVTRRGFIRTVGIGGVAATALGIPGGVGAQAPAAGQAAAMPKRKLGKTGAEVSILCLGGMFDTVNNQLLLRQALNWGVTYWDTAEGYGNGLSEEGFGRFFTRYPETRKNIFLVTKFRPSPPDKLSEALDKGLKRLCTDYVDVFFTHGISDFNQITGGRDWAEQMKRAGKIKFFGFSTHTNMEDCLLAAAKSGWIDSVMFTYNFRLMNSPKMKEAVDACAQAGIGLTSFKTQAGGQVKADSETEFKLVQKFLERGFTDKQAKLKAVWENPQIASICSQMPNLAYLSANVAAARDLKALAKSDFEALDRFASETRSGYCAGCGRICQAAVGGKVPVNDVMRCLMYYRDYGDRELARGVFAGLSEVARSQLTEVDYSKAENACPQGLAIATLMAEASELLA
ncbi:MAG TPA: aldo/keto reductase [Desulfobacterales bacterium]|nr:aldo/keto reductase [Desulfobacterales bacterium]